MGRELLSAQVASGALGCAQVVALAGVGGPPGQLTSVMLSARVRSGLEEYVRSHGGTIRDVVQATLVGFLVDQGVMEDPRDDAPGAGVPAGVKKAARKPARKSARTPAPASARPAAKKTASRSRSSRGR